MVLPMGYKFCMRRMGITRNGYRNKLYQFCKIYAELELEFLEFERIVPYSSRTANTEAAPHPSNRL
jgi:hypothetical protein